MLTAKSHDTAKAQKTYRKPRSCDRGFFVEVRRVELLSKTASPRATTCFPFVFEISSSFTPKKVGANLDQPCKSRNTPQGMTNSYPILRPDFNPNGSEIGPGVAD